MPRAFALTLQVDQAGEFSEMFMRPREMRANIWSERMFDVAFDGSRDYDGTGKLDKEHVMRSKLVVETMQWQMARLNPRQWADKRQIDAAIQAKHRGDEPASTLGGDAWFWAASSSSPAQPSRSGSGSRRAGREGHR